MALFFKKKKTEEPKNEILSINNIRTRCTAANLSLIHI